VLATDLSVRALREAYGGVYPDKAVAPLPERLRSRYLSIEEGQATVSPALQARVAFKRLNLSQPPFPMQGPLDVVFCRNVMIYFDQRVRQGLVTEVERLMRPGGLLLIGHTETLHGLRTGLRLVKPSVYQRPEGTP
jgi:chemotaxis protein methyltransferase CheR